MIGARRLTPDTVEYDIGRTIEDGSMELVNLNFQNLILDVGAHKIDRVTM